MSLRRNLFLVFGLVAVLGGGLLCGSAYWVSSTRAFLERSVATTGKVVEVHAQTTRDNEGENHTSYTSIVQFTGPSNETIRFTPNISSSSPAVIGTVVALHFERDNPRDARVDRWAALWGGALLLGLLGAAGTLVGGLGLLKARRMP